MGNISTILSDGLAENEILVLSKKGVILARGKNGDAAVVEALKTDGSRKAIKLETKEIWANIAAKLASKAIYVALAAVIIGTLVAAIWLTVKAYNADAEAARKAAEAAENLKEKSEETARALESVSSAIDKYNQLVETFNECTKGTEEWYNALKAVNDEVLSILEKNPELAKQMQIVRDENGMLTIANKD
jgi:predicted nucleotide-binding protein (sugar kinase/HSP70/actin superfamily)